MSKLRSSSLGSHNSSHTFLPPYITPPSLSLSICLTPGNTHLLLLLGPIGYGFLRVGSGDGAGGAAAVAVAATVVWAEAVTIIVIVIVVELNVGHSGRLLLYSSRELGEFPLQTSVPPEENLKSQK